MFRSVWVRGSVLGFAVAAVALTAVIASGHEKTYKKLKAVGTTLQYANVDPPPADPRLPPPADPTDTFSGKLFKVRGSGPCPLSNRKVKVFRAVPSHYPGETVGEATTAADGSWQLDAEDVLAGEYRARASKVIGTIKIAPIPGIEEGHIHKHVCRGKISNTILAGP